MNKLDLLSNTMTQLSKNHTFDSLNQTSSLGVLLIKYLILSEYSSVSSETNPICSKWQACVDDGNLLRLMYIDPCTGARARGGELCPEETWGDRAIVENTPEDTLIFSENMMNLCPVCVRKAEETMPGAGMIERLRNARTRKGNEIREAFANWPATNARLLAEERSQGEFQR
ncbi:hypothetical protein BPOR_0294g00100 [Botrytis porri]|uniref:Uncharacterized protein n=1 Tax=Botrytis porri TaxID=87229 RepID=A0A4Z1KKE2_9HELO|nr:hypothetical protein BPOR_0294g00100 [Botrytis porri]